MKIKELDGETSNDDVGWLPWIDRGVDPEPWSSRHVRQDRIRRMKNKGDAFIVKGAEVKVKEVLNRLQLDNSVSRVTSIHVYTIRIYVTYCFRGCTTTKGNTACFAPLTLFIVCLCIHPSLPLSSQFHEWELLYYDVYHGAEFYGDPCHGFGRKCYYFSQFAKQMLPIVKSPPRRYHSVARGLFSWLVSDSRQHCDILPSFVQQNEFFYTRIRAIVKFLCPCVNSNVQEGGKRE